MYTYTHLEDFIQNIYLKLNIQEPHQVDMYTISKSLNIGIHKIKDNSQALWFEGRHYIFLDSRLTSPEQFEEFGHELGHVLLHESSQQQITSNYQTYQEWKANLFALHFCIPTFMLQTLPNDMLNKHNISELFGVTKEFADIRLEKYLNKRLYYSYTKKLQIVAEKQF